MHPVSLPTSPARGAETPKKRWRAHLELRFERRQKSTVLTHRKHVGPLLVQRPFYPEQDGTCHVYLVHPPGGVVGGDELRIDVDVRESSQCLITTPAASKFYRSSGQVAEQTANLSVAPTGRLEWLPQETILFEGAKVTQAATVSLADEASFIGWEMVCFGRPAANEEYRVGRYRSRLDVWRGDRPVCLERAHFDGGGAALSSTWGMAGLPVLGTLVCTGADSSVLSPIRDAVGESQSFCATILDDTVVCRYRGASTEEARAQFTLAWSLLRQRLFGQPGVSPRIWAT